MQLIHLILLFILLLLVLLLLFVCFSFSFYSLFISSTLFFFLFSSSPPHHFPSPPPSPLPFLPYFHSLLCNTLRYIPYKCVLIDWWWTELVWNVNWCVQTKTVTATKVKMRIQLIDSLLHFVNRFIEHSLAVSISDRFIDKLMRTCNLTKQETEHVARKTARCRNQFEKVINCKPLIIYLALWMYRTCHWGSKPASAEPYSLNPRIAKEGVVSTPSTIVYKISRNFFEFFWCAFR